MYMYIYLLELNEIIKIGNEKVTYMEGRTRAHVKMPLKHNYTNVSMLKKNWNSENN